MKQLTPITQVTVNRASGISGLTDVSTWINSDLATPSTTPVPQARAHIPVTRWSICCNLKVPIAPFYFVLKHSHPLQQQTFPTLLPRCFTNTSLLVHCPNPSSGDPFPPWTATLSFSLSSLFPQLAPVTQSNSNDFQAWTNSWFIHAISRESSIFLLSVAGLWSSLTPASTSLSQPLPGLTASSSAHMLWVCPCFQLIVHLCFGVSVASQLFSVKHVALQRPDCPIQKDPRSHPLQLSSSA